jgi:DNA mismatch repair ATPase MutS
MVTSSNNIGDIEYTYKIENGISNIKGGVKILEKLDFPKEIIEMTNDVLKQIDIFV